MQPTRYESPSEQMARLEKDAAKFAKGHARLIKNSEDIFVLKQSRRLFETKIYNERLAPRDRDRIVGRFYELVDKEITSLLEELHAMPGGSGGAH